MRYESYPRGSDDPITFRRGTPDTVIMEYGNGAPRVYCTCNRADAQRIADALNMQEAIPYVPIAITGPS